MYVGGRGNRRFQDERGIFSFPHSLYSLGASLVAQTVKNLPTMQETWVGSLGQEDPLEKGIPSPVLLPGEFHEQRSLAGYSLRGRKEWD